MTPRDSAALRTTFPFDTTLCYTCEPAPSRWPGFNMMRVDRYDDTVFYQDPVYPTICPCTTYADLAHHRLPLLGDQPLLIKRVITGLCARLPFTVNVTETEYLSPLDSVVLYLRVLGGDSSTLHVRFDTACSLPARIAGAFPRTQRVRHWFTPSPQLEAPWFAHDTSGCPGTTTTQLEGPLSPVTQPEHALRLTYWPPNEAGYYLWPWPPDTAPEIPDYNEAIVRIYRRPADSTAPVMVRHVRADCSDSAVEYHNEGVEYYFALSRVAGLYMRVVEIDADSVTLEYDTVSFLGRTGVAALPGKSTAGRSAWPVELVAAGAGRVVVRVGALSGERSAGVELVVTDLAGRTVATRRVVREGIVTLTLPESRAAGCYCVSAWVAGRPPRVFPLGMRVAY